MNRQRLKIIIICFICGLAYLTFVLITGWGIPCPVKTLSGGKISCPGCGVSTMCVALAHFDFKEAFEANPVILCLLPTWITGLTLWVLDRGKRIRGVIIWGSIGLLVLFGILRNVIH